MMYCLAILDSQQAVGIGRPASLHDLADLLAKTAAGFEFQRCFTVSSPKLGFNPESCRTNHNSIQPTKISKVRIGRGRAKNCIKHSVP